MPGPEYGVCAPVCRAGPTFNPFLPGPAPPPNSAGQRAPHPHPDPLPATAGGPLASQGSGPRAAPTASFPCLLPSARRPRVAPRRADGEGVPPRPGPLCGPFKSRPLNPFSSADRSRRPSPRAGWTAQPPPRSGPGPVGRPRAGAGAREAVRPEERRSRAEGRMRAAGPSPPRHPGPSAGQPPATSPRPPSTPASRPGARSPPPPSSAGTHGCRGSCW